MEFVIRIILTLVLETAGEKAAMEANRRLRRLKRKWVRKIRPVIIKFIWMVGAASAVILILTKL